MIVTPAPEPLWREVLEGDDAALAFQTPEWIAALRAAGGYEDASRAYVFADGVRAVLPLVRRSGRLPKALAPQASMPHAWGTGGLIADGPLRPAHLERVTRELATLPAIQTAVRPNPLHARLWESAPGAAVTPRCAHVLDLDGGPDHVWKHRFSSNARRGVRKAERAGVEVACGTDQRLLDAFHHLLGTSVERWAVAQNEPLLLSRWRARRRDPHEKFSHIARALGDALRVWVAYHRGAPVAAAIVVVGRDASYTRGAMDKALAGPVCANDLLHWHAIRDACAAGCLRYHMGESGGSRPLARFKEKFGAEPHAYAEYRFERLPLTRWDARARGLAKRALRFRDA